MVRSCGGECEWMSVVVETIRMGVEIEERTDNNRFIIEYLAPYVAHSEINLASCASPSDSRNIKQ